MRWESWVPGSQVAVGMAAGRQEIHIHLAGIAVGIPVVAVVVVAVAGKVLGIEWVHFVDQSAAEAKWATSQIHPWASSGHLARRAPAGQHLSCLGEARWVAGYPIQESM